MAEHELNKFSAHAQRDLNAWTNPERDPGTITDGIVTMESPPASGRHSGDTMKTPDGHAGADTKGL